LPRPVRIRGAHLVEFVSSVIDVPASCFDHTSAVDARRCIPESGPRIKYAVAARVKVISPATVVVRRAVIDGALEGRGGI
jgi:hypothetical protein